MKALFSFLPILLCALTACQPGVKSVYHVDLDTAVSVTEAGSPVLLRDEVVLDPTLRLSDDVLVQVYDGIILLGDRGGNNPAMYLMDRDGLLHNVIYQEGSGQEDYAVLSDFQYRDETVEILDGRQGRLLHFSLEGDFEDAVQAEALTGANGYIRDGDSYWFDHSLSPEESAHFSLIRTDEKLEIKEQHFPCDETPGVPVAARRSFWKLDGHVHYFQPRDLSAYELVPGKEPRALWALDFGQHDIDRESLNATETPGQICLGLTCQGRKYLATISKKTGNTLILRFEGAIPSGFLPVTAWEDWFVALDPDIPLLRFFKFDVK